MTKLSEKIPIKYIKQSKKLQKIYGVKRSVVIKHQTQYYNEDFDLTIADIIDNAEILFSKYFNKILVKTYLRITALKEENISNSEFICREILNLCIQNKSIDEIAKYIIDNIK